MSNCVVGSGGLGLPCSINAEQQLLTSMRGVGPVLAFSRYNGPSLTRLGHFIAPPEPSALSSSREAVGHAQSENDCNPPGGGNKHCRP